MQRWLGQSVQVAIPAAGCLLKGRLEGFDGSLMILSEAEGVGIKGPTPLLVPLAAVAWVIPVSQEEGIRGSRSEPNPRSPA